MKRDKYVEAKKLLAQLHHILATRPLSPEKRDALEHHAARLACALAVEWLPRSWVTRFIMGALLALGLQQAWSGDYVATFVLLALLPLFSPHIVTEVLSVLDKHQQRLNDQHPSEQERPPGRVDAVIREDSLSTERPDTPGEYGEIHRVPPVFVRTPRVRVLSVPRA